jgi:murein peptide amidase A
MDQLFKWPDFLDEFSEAALRQGFRSEVLLDTQDGPLMAWERDGNGPLVYASAGIHGDEPAGPLALLEMMKAGKFSERNHWLICPALNPGGLAMGRRENREGIDLNRDYLQQSTAEIAAHARWLKRDRIPDVFISLHEDWETEGFYFYEINLLEDQPQRAAGILEGVAEIFPAESGSDIDGHEPRAPGWIYHGAEADLPNAWPEAIYLAKLGCPLSFTFETPSQSDLGKRVRAHVSAFQRSLGLIG